MSDDARILAPSPAPGNSGTCDRDETILRRLTRTAPCALLLALAACGPGSDSSDGPASGGAAPSGAAGGSYVSADGPIDMAVFAEAFEIVDTLVLEETAAAMVAIPMVTADGSGLLVAEPIEAQVNVYGADGSLQAVYGGKGDGPGELDTPLDASRTRDGEIVVADTRRNNLAFYKPDSDDQPEVFQLPVEPVEGVMGARDMGGGRYLLASMFPGPLLHVWNRGTGEVERSFFEPGVSEAAQGLASSMGRARIAVAGDTIWAVWTLADTLYRFSGDGEHVSSVPLSLPRPIDLPARRPSGLLELQELADNITQVSEIFALGSGEKVIASMQTRGVESVWDLLIVDAQGETVWKAANMPRLLTGHGDLFYFLPEAALPNRWLAARRRAG